MGKKLQLILAALVLGVMLAACGNNSSSGNSSVEVIDNPSGEEREIVILGSNFEFDQDEYTVAVGEAVKLVYRNAEGSHGIAVEDTDIKLRHNQEIVVRFTEAGSFKIICNIYCGAGHTGMTAKLVVQ
jgi:cytochrome c oxidase subunit 2